MRFRICQCDQIHDCCELICYLGIPIRITYLCLYCIIYVSAAIYLMRFNDKYLFYILCAQINKCLLLLILVCLLNVNIVVSSLFLQIHCEIQVQQTFAFSCKYKYTVVLFLSMDDIIYSDALRRFTIRNSLYAAMFKIS